MNLLAITLVLKFLGLVLNYPEISGFVLIILKSKLIRSAEMMTDMSILLCGPGNGYLPLSDLKLSLSLVTEMSFPYVSNTLFLYSFVVLNGSSSWKMHCRGKNS